MTLEPFASVSNLVSFFGDSETAYKDVIKQKELVLSGRLLRQEQFVFAEQVDSSKVAVIDCDKDCEPDRGMVTGVDALVTKLTDILLTIRTADCIPILLYDPEHRAVAAIHSGRAGTEDNITGNTIVTMQNHFSSNPTKLSAAIGPSICGFHYPVADELFNAFVEKTDLHQEYPNLDLRITVKKQLTDAGLPEKNIIDFPVCTFENPSYFSYRRNRTSGRQISCIGLTNA